MVLSTSLMYKQRPQDHRSTSSVPFGTGPLMCQFAALLGNLEKRRVRLINCIIIWLLLKINVIIYRTLVCFIILPLPLLY